MSTDAGPSDTKWTSQQRQAIEARDVSVSLSAGAGCGKTFVLTERYLAYFDPHDPRALRPDDLHHLVAITFTERAAREMRDRVRRKCYERLLDAPPDAAEYWSGLVRSLDIARISTIHSFCAALLRSHAVEAGIDPQFEVLEQSQTETLLLEVVDDELRRLVQKRDRATMELAARFDLRALAEMLRTLVVEGRDEDVARWLQVAAAEQVATWANCFRETVVPAIARRVAASPAASRVLALLGEHVPNDPVMRERRDVLLAKLPSLAAEADGAQLVARLGEVRASARVQGGGNHKHWDSREAYDAFRDAAARLRDTIDAALGALAFDLDGAEEPALVGGQLLAIAEGARRRFAERKQELVAMDFDDLLVRARALLVDPRNVELKRRLASNTHLLLVDEFQDTDRLQVELVKALCGDGVQSGRLFVVGDYKQSIYRFRGADPHVFRGLRDEMPEKGRLALTCNFRSQPAILHFVNALFWHDLNLEQEPLRAHRPQATAVPAVEFLWAPSAAGPPKEDVESLRRREAEWIARRIRAMLDGGEPLVVKDGVPRPAQPGDVAILFRALSNVELYEEALRRQGIDYYLVGGHAFYAQQEIFDLLNLLRAVASPSDGVSLAGALRSGFFALTDETLFWLAQHPDGFLSGLFSASPPAQIGADQLRRVAFAAETITHLRDAKDRVPICELIERAMTFTGYDATLLAEFLGERKLANLRKVIEQARSFERGAAFGLADFIAELSEFVARQPKEPLAATFSEDTNVVRLMTIHQAKGLEFPIVIVPDVDSKTDHRAPPVHFDSALGPLVQLPEDSRGNRPTGGYELWRFTEHAEELAELDRLLYVATTRAADYLMLASGVLHLGEAKGVWMQLLARRFDLLTGRLVGPLPADEPRPQIKVTTSAPLVASAGSGGRGNTDWKKIIADVREHAAATGPTVIGAIQPIEVDAAARRQYSFSRLTGALKRRREPSNEHLAGGPRDVDPLRLGTLVHAVLAAIDFADPGHWQKLVGLHAERQLLADSALAAEATALIERFMTTPRAGELARAKQSLAEVEFLLAWPPDGANDSRIILTGFIDRLCQDGAGRWHVIDFKTNRVTPENVARVAGAYEMQMLVYALATEQILGSPPESLTLHFLQGGIEHPFDWDDVARRRAVALVDEGIAAARGESPIAAPAASM